MSSARDVIFRILGEDLASPAFNKAAASAEGAAARISRAGERMSTAGSKLTRSITLPVLAIGAVAIKSATDFNASMTRIQTQAGASAKDVKYLTNAVLGMRNVQQGPNELAGALYHLKSVGMQNVTAMHALRQASDLAAVGGANLEETTNALAGAWRTGIQGAQNFRSAAATVNAIIGAGNMTLEDFNGALGTGILASAKTFGLSLKDVGSALALFTDESVPADAAATRLRMTFSLLGAPSQKAEGMLNGIGLTGLRLANDMRKPNGLITAIGDLKSHLEDPKFHLSLSQQAQLLSRAFGGGRSSSAILSMINNYDVLKQKQQQVTDSLAKYNAAVAAQRKTPAAQFAIRIADLQRAAIILGNDLLPAATGLAHEVSHLVDGFNNLSPSTRHAIEDAAKWAALLGPALLIGGKLIRLFTGLWRVVTFPARVLTGWGAANRTMTATGTTATQTATRVSLASLKYDAAQLSQQSATARAAAVIAVNEANKANAAVRAAEEIATAARAAGGAESVLAERAATDARLFAQAKQLEADAAVKSAATVTIASQRATQALGRQQMENASLRQQRAMGIGMGVGGALLMGGMMTHGTPSSALTRAGVGAMLGSAILPGVGTAVGAGVGALSSVVDIGESHGPNPLGNVMAAQAIDKQVKSLGGSMQGFVLSSQKYKAAFAAAFDKNTPAAVSHLRAVTNGLISEYRHAQTAGQFTADLANGTANLGRVADLAGHKIISLSAAVGRLSRGMLGVASANLSFRLGLKDLPGQLNKHSKAIAGDTRAALENRQALVGLLGQVQQHAAAMQAAGKSAPKVAKAIDQDVASLRAVAIKAGVSKSAFHDLIAQMHLTPKAVHTQIIADTTSASSKLTSLQAQLNAISGSTYTAHVTASGAINITGNGQHMYAGKIATGGYIVGPGSGTSDSILAHVSNGEYVVNAAATKRNRGLLDAINYGTRRFSRGGPVDGSAPAMSSSRRRRTVRLHLDLTAGSQALGSFIRDIVLDELDYADAMGAM